MLARVVRYILLGPLLGAFIGLTQAVITATVWIAHGQPDFYFRGWEGVRLTMVTLTLGGLIVGVPFGVVVVGLENKLGRRVRVAPGSICTIVVVAAATWIMVEIEYARQKGAHRVALKQLWKELPISERNEIGQLLAQMMTRKILPPKPEEGSNE